MHVYFMIRIYIKSLEVNNIFALTSYFQELSKYHQIYVSVSHAFNNCKVFAQLIILVWFVLPTVVDWSVLLMSVAVFVVVGPV